MMSPATACFHTRWAPASGPDRRTAGALFRTALAAAAVFLAAGCAERRNLESTADVYSRWFVSPTAAGRDTLLSAASQRQPVARVAELAVRRSRHGQGAGSAVLCDPHGDAYTLGYAAPAGFRADRLYPLVVYLHGGVTAAASTKGERAWEMLGALADSCEAFLASPTATRAVPWWSPGGVERVLQAVRFMALHYPVDPARVVLAGVSDGAVGCYAVATIAPGPFAGFIAISGHGAMLPSLGVPLTPGNLMQRPIYDIHAGRDRLYPIEENDAFLQALAGQGVNVERQVYPDEDHGFDYRDREMGALASRVRSWRRPADRRGISWRILPGYPCCADNLVSVRYDTGIAGLPGLNAHWDERRLVVRSTGIREFTFRAPRLDRPPVVVANGKPEARSKDMGTRPAAVLDAVQQSCFPVPAQDGLYAVVITGGG